MATSTFSFFSSIFGFIVAAISLLAFIVNICRSHLPSNKIKVLESLLDETETDFKKAVEDGLLTELPFVRRTERRLAILRSRTNDLRSRAYNATNLQRNYAEFYRGTSTAIGTACQTLKKLRAQVITSSEKGRRRLREMPIHSQGEHRSTNLVDAIGIPRPCSCPPAIAVWRPADMQRTSGFTRNNPFCDPTQSDSDVRTADAQTCASTVHTSVTLELGA
ncbi:hypothetical protein OG21DRAFT_843622 [Imleria badia]|nr:hypothetical protein OG21DRAFT_843622 [Imleria badia]